MGRTSHICLGLAGSLVLTACSTMPSTPPVTRPTLQSQSGLHLPDKVQFLQTDKRWARQTLGGSGESLASDGCLVTAAAMALVNLGFQTDPGDLAYRLKAYGGFNSRGWLVWSGLEKATSGKAETVFYDRKDNAAVRSCLSAGYYPLVRFNLPNSRTHWAMVVRDSKQGFYIRDPMISSNTPIPLSSRTKTIDAVRCIGIRA
ncbi:MAG: hypothetical protein L3J65_02850 [Robiginitomaculum sp.]|nr:hypothetical protein [Robiginitomaculum sp.]